MDYKHKYLKYQYKVNLLLEQLGGVITTRTKSGAISIKNYAEENEEKIQECEDVTENIINDWKLEHKKDPFDNTTGCLYLALLTIKNGYTVDSTDKTPIPLLNVLKFGYTLKSTVYERLLKEFVEYDALYITPLFILQSTLSCPNVSCIESKVKEKHNNKKISIACSKTANLKTSSEFFPVNIEIVRTLYQDCLMFSEEAFDKEKQTLIPVYHNNEFNKSEEHINSVISSHEQKLHEYIARCDSIPKTLINTTENLTAKQYEKIHEYAYL